jgi:hypothetical protein
MRPNELSAYTQAVLSVILSRITNKNKENCIIHNGYLVLVLLTAFADDISELETQLIVNHPQSSHCEYNLLDETVLPRSPHFRAWYADMR